VAAVITHILTEPPVFPPGMSGDISKVFRSAMAQDPEERPATLMDFLLPLVDAYPLDPNSRVRVNELFRHDDHAGDIVPLRRLRPGIQTTSEPLPGVASSGRGTGGPGPGVRSTPSLPMPSYTQPSAVKIELETEAPAGSRPSQAQNPDRKSRGDGEGLSPLTLVKWFVGILVAGQLFWWVFNFLQNAPGTSGK